MIGKLTGLLDSVAVDSVIVDVQGVGYIVHTSAQVLSHLPAAGERVTLWIETAVREDAITLYGFADPADKLWFRLLTSVQGVGAKAALAVQSVLNAEDIARAVMLADVAAVTRANGVGKKLAERIVNELKDKVPKLGSAGVRVPVPAGNGKGRAAAAPDPAGDAVSALVNLGYGLSDASRAVQAASQKAGDDASVEALIRMGLGELMK
jgi:Holliday junction DNA helicase RuvA